MSLNDLFAIGASGTRVYQAAMGAISDNITNADTPGYSRRSVLLQESPTSSAQMPLYNNSASFSGVMVNSVVRADDPYLSSAARTTANALGSANQRATWMNNVQNALNDTDLGVGQRMTAMFSSVQQLAANPTDTTLRTSFLFSLDQVNTAFQQSSSDLKAVSSGIGSTAQNDVTALNDAIKQLANANEGLRRTPAGQSAHVQLLDSRDQALAEISKHVNVTVNFGNNDVANVDYGGGAVVDNLTPYAFAVKQAPDGTLSFTLDGADVADPTGGSLAGLAQSAQVTKQRTDTLNSIASQYVSDVNSWHSAGVTDAGAAGQPLLAIGADAGDLSVLVSDPADIAAASSAGVSNGNLLAINSIRGTGSIEDRWTALISDQGNTTSATLAEQTAAQKRDDMAQQALGDVSGVNLDREAADLLRLQQAYQASARVIQVARELSQTIFAIF